MADVKHVYLTVRDLVNKDSRGFITPAMFNEFAQAAQMTVFNRIVNDLSIASKARKGGMDPGRNLSQRKALLEDLGHFVVTANDQTVTSGSIDRPSDMYKLISVTTKGLLSGYRSRNRQVEIVYDEEKIDRILRSTLSAPSEEYPVALISDTIEIFPENIKKVNLRYYKHPGSTLATLPFIEVTDYSGVEVFTADCVDFELPEHYAPDLIIEIAKMVGVNLKEAEVQAYGSNPAIPANTVSPKK